MRANGRETYLEVLSETDQIAGFLIEVQLASEELVELVGDQLGCQSIDNRNVISDGTNQIHD